jgi:methyl halide transferase
MVGIYLELQDEISFAIMNVEMKKIQEEHGPKNSWIVMWEQSQTPWNTGEPALALKYLLDQKRIPNEGHFLVPGCGQGYDCLALFNNIRIVYGIDLSPLVIEQNINRQKELQLSTERLKFIAGDFFELNPPFETGFFDFLMDYTFLCAIEPSMRPRWASELKRLLKSGAMLVTLMYPLSDHEGGPPYALSTEIYKNLLQDSFELLSIEDAPTIERRQGKEKLAIWKRM